MDFNLQKIRRNPTAAAVVFSLFLTAAESFVFEQNYSLFLQTVALNDFSGWRELFFVVFASAALVFFVRSTLVSRFSWQCVYFAVFAFAISIEYGFHGALGRFALPTDVENALYASDASDKYGAITLFFSPLIFAPLIVFRLLFRLASENAPGGAKLFCLNLAILFFGFTLAADFHPRVLPINAFAAHFNNLTVATLYFGSLKFDAPPRMSVKALENPAPENNIVFIVDESVRADHLSLNGYKRKTTPTLDRLQREKRLKNWGAAVSGATESVGSNRLLLTGLADLPDRDDQIRRLPTIFQYARAAGYKTFYFDGQSYADWLGSENDRKEFGQIFTALDFPGVEQFDLDRAFAEKIREIVGTSRGNFIWVNKRGVHFRYEKNYPVGEKIWTPTDLETDEAENAEPLVNNYDNAIFYNSESFFRPLVGDQTPDKTVFVYTSDHGQTLIPNRATHAGDSKAEALVPLFIIGDDRRVQNADTRFRAAHRHLFAALLDLMNYPRNLRERDYSLSLFEATAADSEPRTYFVGNLSGAFGGRELSFDETEK